MPECGIFSGALNAVLNLEEVAGPRPWTLLVPTDQAFVCLTTAAMDELLHSSRPLTELVRMHLVQGVYTAHELDGQGWLQTVRGDYLPVDVFGDVRLIGGAQIICPDHHLACGVAHVIDRVLGQVCSAVGDLRNPRPH